MEKNNVPCRCRKCRRMMKRGDDKDEAKACFMDNNCPKPGSKCDLSGEDELTPEEEEEEEEMEKNNVPCRCRKCRRMKKRGDDKEAKACFKDNNCPKPDSKCDLSGEDELTPEEEEEEEEMEKNNVPCRCRKCRRMMKRGDDKDE